MKDVTGNKCLTRDSEGKKGGIFGKVFGGFLVAAVLTCIFLGYRLYPNWKSLALLPPLTRAGITRQPDLGASVRVPNLPGPESSLSSILVPDGDIPGVISRPSMRDLMRGIRELQRKGTIATEVIRLKRHPAVKAFIEDFQKDPKLMVMWEAFRRSPNPQHLVRELKNSQKFRELIEKHGRSEEFKDLMEEVRGSPLASLLPVPGVNVWQSVPQIPGQRSGPAPYAGSVRPRKEALLRRLKPRRGETSSPPRMQLPLPFKSEETAWGPRPLRHGGTPALDKPVSIPGMKDKRGKKASYGSTLPPPSP